MPLWDVVTRAREALDTTVTQVRDSVRDSGVGKKYSEWQQRRREDALLVARGKAWEEDVRRYQEWRYGQQTQSQESQQQPVTPRTQPTKQRQHATPAFPRRRTFRRVARSPWSVLLTLAAIGLGVISYYDPPLGKYLVQQGLMLAEWIFADIVQHPWLLIVLLVAGWIWRRLGRGHWVLKTILGIMVVASFRVPALPLTLIPLALFVAKWALLDIAQHPWLVLVIAAAGAVLRLTNDWRWRRLRFLFQSTAVYAMLLLMINPTAPQKDLLERIEFWPIWLVIVWLAWRLIPFFRALGFRFFLPFD